VIGSKNGGYVCWGRTVTGWFIACSLVVRSVLESLHGLFSGTFPQFLRLKADGVLFFVSPRKKKKV